MIPTTSRSVDFSSTARSSRSSNASGRWASSPGPQSILFEAESQNSNRVINFSTGRVINKVYLENEVTTMDNDHTGQLIFSGDTHGCIYTVSVNSHTGSISTLHKNRSMRNRSVVTTVQYRTFSLVARCPVLLVCAQDGSLCFFRVALEIRGYLILLCSLKLAPRLHSMRASFCPLPSLEKGEFVGSWISCDRSWMELW